MVLDYGRNGVCSEAHAACLAAGVSGPHRFRWDIRWSEIELLRFSESKVTSWELEEFLWARRTFFHLKNHRGFFPKSFDQIIFQISFPKNQTKHDIVELRVRSFDPRITTPCYGSSISSSTRPGTGPSSIRPSVRPRPGPVPCDRWITMQVEATKPTASRNVSAEIFVICIGPGVGWFGLVWLEDPIVNSHPALRLERDQKPDWLQVLWSKAGHLRDSEGAMILRYCQMLLKVVFEDINATLILSSFCLNHPLTTYLDPLLLVNAF